MYPWLSEVLLETFVLGAMLVGLIGLAVPLVPGLVIIWLAALGYGIFAGFSTLGWVMFAIITILMIAGSIVDNILMGTKAYSTGAPWWSVLIALVAGVAGNFALPVIGGVLAALLTLFLIEWLRRKDWRLALTSVKGMATGCGWAFVIRFVMGMVMIGLWMIWAWV